MKDLFKVTVKISKTERWQYKSVLDYEARNCRTATMIEREQIFNNRTKPSMFYIACCA